MLLFTNAQDILEGQRDPIIVETKADLQSELELLPINYQREEKADSLIKFNYAYHGRPIKSDFVLFPEKELIDYLKIYSGNMQVFGLVNNLTLGNFNHKLNYQLRKDDQDRSANIISLDNSYTKGKHALSLSANYLKSLKDRPNLNIENETHNFSLNYTYSANKGYISKLAVQGQYENNKTKLIDSTDYLNFLGQFEVNPLNNFYAKIEFANNHKHANTQVSLNYKNIVNLGLWTGFNKDRVLIAPNINLYLNHDNISLKLTNKPYLEQNTYSSLYACHLYGYYGNNQTDYFVPANANLDVSYFNLLTWSLGSNYKYALDAPIYRSQGNSEGLYLDSYWKSSYYAKIAYYGHNIDLSSKAEFIDYNNFDSDYLPFTPEISISNSISFNYSKFDLTFDYLIERGAYDDYNVELDTNHILNVHANYHLKNWLTLWTELSNLLANDHSSYHNDRLNKREIQAGLKLFF